MNKNINTILHYHNTTKHSPSRYARSLGYMDWATQPNPFREYKGSQKLLLPLALNYPTPPYMLLDTDLPDAPLCKESLSQLLQFSMGIAAYKTTGSDQWAVRCNASSGNLHPTESYIVLPPVQDLPHSHVGIYHYAPKNHELELLCDIQSDFFQTLPKGSMLLGLSSIAWREVWKYGERAFRYVHLDAGHALQSVVVAAKLLGWKATRITNLHDTQLDTLFGLDQTERFCEKEHADMLLVLSPHKVSSTLDITPLLATLPRHFAGYANQLSPQMHPWELIDTIIEATHAQEKPKPQITTHRVVRTPSKESKEVIMKRRSVHVMDSSLSTLTQEQFHTILLSVAKPLDEHPAVTHLTLFLHRVEGYEKGLYLLVRNNDHLKELQQLMYNDFLWQKTPFENLYLLQKEDYRFASKAISCSQAIASDGAFSLGMLTRFSQELELYGEHRYKELYWECGAIGQQLYLEATSLGCSGTGIGCFLDDTMHSLLGLKGNQYQTLYHFTVGRGFVDSRIMTLPPYPKREH